MKIIRFDEGKRYEPERNWKRISLCAEEDVSIEHFIKPARHASPRHDHDNAQVLVVLSGCIRVATDDEELELTEGDTVYIPGGVSHVVTNTADEPSAGLDIFVPGRSFDFWLKRKQTENGS